MGSGVEAGQRAVVRARALLKKVLATPVWVRPADEGWRFAGVARYDLVLAGGLTGSDYFVEHRPGLVDPEQIFLWFAEADGAIPPRDVARETTFVADGDRVTVREGFSRIAGGSDGVPTGCATDMAPTPPNLRHAPARLWNPHQNTDLARRALLLRPTGAAPGVSDSGH